MLMGNKNLDLCTVPRNRWDLPFALALTASTLSTLSTDVARANVVGTDTQNFNPTTQAPSSSCSPSSRSQTPVRP